VQLFSSAKAQIARQVEQSTQNILIERSFGACARCAP
jgi:hypothetical protein